MVIYADVLFFINFSMDFLSLFICSLVTHRAYKKKRIIFASSLGAVYGVLQVIINLEFITGVVICILVAVLMINVTFKEKKVNNIIILTAIYFFVSTALGGIMSLIYTTMNGMLTLVISNYTYEGVYNGARLFVIIFLTLIVSLLFTKALNSKKDLKSVALTVKIMDKNYDLEGLCDTGNMLKEPFSGKSVILVVKSCEIGMEISKIDENKKKYIPYKDVHGEGMLKGVMPKELMVDGIIRSAYIAVCETVDFAGYDALVPGALL